MKLLPSFTHPHSVQNLYDLLSSVESKSIVNINGVQTRIDFYCVNKRKQDKTNKQKNERQRKENKQYKTKTTTQNKTKQNTTHKTRQNTEECKNKTLNKQIANNKKFTSSNEAFQKAV